MHDPRNHLRLDDADWPYGLDEDAVEEDIDSGDEAFDDVLADIAGRWDIELADEDEPFYR